MNNNKRWTKLCTIFIAIIFVFNLFTINVKASDSDDTLNKIKEIIKQNYIKEVPQEVLNAKNIDDLIKLLGDPYTEYLSANEYEDFMNQIDMKFVGIGVNIEIVPEGVKVVSLIQSSSAEEMGIKPDDIIISADGVSLEGLSNQEAANLLMGKAGTSVKLKVKRGESVINFDIVRKEIYSATVTGSILNNHIGYIQLKSFGSETAEEFSNVLHNLKSKKADSYIVDLRNNLGGYMNAALDIAGYFIGNQTAIIVEDKDNSRGTVKAVKHSELIDKPVIFLINDYSASASEILAAAVKDYNKAFFIGENTYGKGVAQSLYGFEDGSAFKTTTLKFFSPHGNVINGIGISPNLEIKDVDPLIAAGLLLGNSKNSTANSRYISVKLGNRNFQINLSDIKSEDCWTAYKHIITKSSMISIIDSKPQKTVVPEIRLTSPVIQYKTGQRAAFKINTPNYGGRVQYRVMLWDDTTKTWRDLWARGDRYYSGWKPYGNETFTLGFTAAKTGSYRIKVFVKRAGLQNSKAALKGMNCDSYLGEIPFTVSN